jgi:hypothetical protein
MDQWWAPATGAAAPTTIAEPGKEPVAVARLVPRVAPWSDADSLDTWAAHGADLMLLRRDQRPPPSVSELASAGVPGLPASSSSGSSGITGVASRDGERGRAALVSSSTVGVGSSSVGSAAHHDAPCGGGSVMQQVEALAQSLLRQLETAAAEAQHPSSSATQSPPQR